MDIPEKVVNQELQDQPKTLAQKVETAINLVIQFAAYAAAVVLVFMMLLTVAEVCLRFSLNRPIFGSIEIVESSLVTLAFLAIVYCTMEDSHVKMDILTRYFPLKAQQYIEVVGYLLCLALFVPMAYLSLPEAFRMRITGESSTVLSIPTYPLYFVICFACAMVSLVLIGNVIKAVVVVVKK
jgi:TRAP-type C4-dicarboxylate transport system permease small subunit